MTIGAYEGLFGTDQAFPKGFGNDGVVPGYLVHAVGGDEVGPAVADIGDENLTTDDKGGYHGRAMPSRARSDML